MSSVVVMHVFMQSFLTCFFHSNLPNRWFSTRFPHSIFTDSFRFFKSLINSRTEDNRPVTVFHQETENRSESGEEVMKTKNVSERNKKQSKGKEDGKAVSENELQLNKDKTNDESTKEEEKHETVEADPADSVTPDSVELPSNMERSDENLSKVYSNTALPAPEGPPDTSEMMPFTLDSPGGACVISLSLMSLGLLSVYISIPKQIVVVDSNLVDNDVAKR